jgi:hypothetical protein
MRHEERQALIRRKFALECKVTSLSREGLAAADVASLATSYGLAEPDAQAILNTEKSRRRM